MRSFLEESLDQEVGQRLSQHGNMGLRQHLLVWVVTISKQRNEFFRLPKYVYMHVRVQTYIHICTS